MGKYPIRRFISTVEFLMVYVLGKILGIPVVVRYLRNPDPAVAVRLLRCFGARVGKRTRVKGALFIDNAWEDTNSTGDFRHLSIGRNCYLGDGVFLDLSNGIHMGDNVVVSGRVAILTHADCHRSEFLSDRFPRQCRPVRIHNDVWLGFGATILHGVVVGPDSVVGAHSLVREDVPPNRLHTGVPAGEAGCL